jgi:hypothetical protein
VGTCDRTPVISIDGVTPDRNGNIDIVFDGDVIVGGVQDGLVLDYPFGSSDICPPVTPVIYEMIPGDCAPELLSSSSAPEPPESSSGVPVSSSSAPSSIVPPGPPSYVLDFESASLFPLVVQAGVVDIQDMGGYTNRAVADSLVAGNEAVDLYYDRPNIADGFTLGSVIKPRNSGMREGHVTFGYRNSSDFWFFSVQTYHPSYPYGLFYVGRRRPIPGYGGGTTGPGVIGSQYFFQVDSIYAFSSGFPLVTTDYTVSLYISKSGANTLINWSVDWLSYYVTQTYVVARSDSQWKESYYDVARIGLGAVATTTEFDYFRINA